MLASQTFFSFTEVPSAADHAEYNEWHQLDHRPENLALSSVRWGERWVHSPDCAAVARATELKRLHYVNMYWFAEPADASRASWSEFAERSFHLGRRGDVRLCNRLLMGFFRSVKGYVSPRVLVSADALPFRPMRGIHLTVSRVRQPRSPIAEQRFAAYDREYIPALLARPGCTGAWTFASESTFATHLDMGGTAIPASIRILLLFLDSDPVPFANALNQDGGVPADDPIEDLLFSGPLRTIVPWEWNWFDGGAKP